MNSRKKALSDKLLLQLLPYSCISYSICLFVNYNGILRGSKKPYKPQTLWPLFTCFSPIFYGTSPLFFIWDLTPPPWHLMSMQYHVLTCLTALSMSQSWKIISGDLPPSSKEHFFKLLTAQLYKKRKTGVTFSHIWYLCHLSLSQVFLWFCEKIPLACTCSWKNFNGNCFHLFSSESHYRRMK